jgi:uncharacterized protein YndB with AHSA1/START domain
MNAPAGDFATKTDDHTIQFVRILPGPIEKVWSFLEDSDKRAQWFARGALPKIVGETFEMKFKHSELSPHAAPAPERMKEMDKVGHTSTYRLLAIEPPHRLVFTFGSDTNPETASRVEFLLTPEGDPKDNKVRLTLTHSRIPDRGFMLGVSGGWHAHLAILQYRAEGQTPPAFWDVWRKYDGVYDKRYA